MIRFVLKRFLISIPMLLAIALLTFVLMRLTPGNFLDSIRMDPSISPETIKHYEKIYQLDKPLITQYFHWVKNILKFEFGYSFYFNIPVTKIIGSRLWNTFVLSFASFLITWCVALPLGIWAAVHRNKWIDKTIQFFSYVGLSLPSFFLGIILLYWASQTNILP
ncbi:Oligopeptide transport system permease protein OppB (TC 3.A.1.5.1), partial [hydrothermal vent metagenome]